jgi:hypothetical protein
VAELESLLEDPELRDEAIEAIRSMIEKILVMPCDGGGVSLELDGDFGVVLGERKNPVSGGDGVLCHCDDLVAGARFELTTFRL